MFPLSNSTLCSMESLAKLPTALYGYLRMLICILHNFYCIPVYVLLTFLLMPLYFVWSDAYCTIENNLYYWLLYVVSSWSYGGGLVVHEHGDDIYALITDPNAKLLIIANHQSTGDVPLMMQSFAARSKWILLWIMDAVFKWTNFGLVSQMHGDYFLQTKNYVSGNITKHCAKDYSMLKNATVLFPEGGFRHKRIASSNAFALKRGHPLLNYVTYPRFSGYNELMNQQLGVTHVVDLTICYDDPESSTIPGIVEIVQAKRCSEVHFHFRVHSVANTENIRSERWLFDQWQAKDKLLARHYNTMRHLKAHNMPTGSLDSLKNGGDTHGGRKTNGNATAAPSQKRKLWKPSDDVLVTTSTTDSSDEYEADLATSASVELLQPNGSTKDVEMNRSGELKRDNDETLAAVVGFDPRLGRPVRLSYVKVLIIHSFYLSVACLIFMLVRFLLW